MPAQGDLPSVVTAACPDCGEDTIHEVLHGTAGSRGGGLTLDATVRCEDCGRVHRTTVREAPHVDVPVVISHGGTSRRARVQLAEDEEVSVDEALIVEGVNTRITGIETKELRRVEDALVSDVKTLWVKEFEELAIGFAINLGHKTITKTLSAKPEDEFSVGDEHLFGRLRVTVHAIKTHERLLKRGSAEAQDIVRVFAKPTPLGPKAYRPTKPQRNQLRAREEHERRWEV